MLGLDNIKPFLPAGWIVSSGFLAELTPSPWLAYFTVLCGSIVAIVQSIYNDRSCKREREQDREEITHLRLTVDRLSNKQAVIETVLDENKLLLDRTPPNPSDAPKE